MSNVTRLIAWAGCFTACVSIGLGAWGQEPPVEPPAEPKPAVPAEPAPIEEPKPEKEKWPFALYVSVGFGVADGEALNTSVVTRETIDQTASTWELPDQQNGRAAIGWKLPRGKGDFRIEFNGYKEDTYELHSRGQSKKTFQFPGLSLGPTAVDFVDWWTVEAGDGRWLAYRTPQFWNSAIDDANGNGVVEVEEVRVGDIDRLVDIAVPESANTRLETFDFLYGREFGGRRYSSRWWGGLRYFDFSGSVVVPAWLGSNDVANGTVFTDAALLSPLVFQQESKGVGPTGAWEVDFNFYDKRLVLYLKGQTAFVITKLEADSGPFFTVLTDGTAAITPASRLVESRDKSVWQNTIEAGGRWNFRNGIGVEFGYTITGYLDTYLLPNLIILPETAPQASAGATALYSTQDHDVEGWHGSVSFQF